MSNKKIKRDMPVGQKVRGYGLLNEYGEFEFFPEQTGTRPTQMKLLYESEDLVLHRCKKCLRATIYLPIENNTLRMTHVLSRIVNNIIIYLRDHEI